MMDKLNEIVIMVEVKVVNKSPYPLPEYATAFAAGLDVRANTQVPVRLEPMQRILVPTGLYVEIPEGYEIQVRPRSGLALKYGITVLNAPGTVDADYRGEIGVILVNLSNDFWNLLPGERIAQLVLSKHERVDWKPVDGLEESGRGSGGFGSTGTK